MNSKKCMRSADVNSAVPYNILLKIHGVSAKLQIDL